MCICTKLETGRNIGGVFFDGTADINLPGVNISGNQDTTGNADTSTLTSTIAMLIQLTHVLYHYLKMQPVIYL